MKGGAVALMLPLAVALTLKASGFLHVGVGEWSQFGADQCRGQDLERRFRLLAVDRRFPRTFPLAAVTVLFRPFIFEAHNAQARLAALESTALIVLFLLRFRWVMAALRSLRRQPYVVFCLDVRRPVHRRVLELRELRPPGA